MFLYDPQENVMMKEYERKVIDLFEKECGEKYTSRLKGMLNQFYNGNNIHFVFINSFAYKFE